MTQRIIQAEPHGFQDTFNRRSFQFRHILQGDSRFELNRLARLAERMLGEPDRRRSVLWQKHDVPISTKWSDIPVRTQLNTVADAIANLNQSGSWVLLYSVQTDPEYAELLETIMGELEILAGFPVRDEVTWQDAYIFLASPQSVTPYHIDHEVTFLFQIHGNRSASIWDQTDRSLLTDEELEQYYLGRLSAANYDESRQADASAYEMSAGTGVHHPSCAPHAFRNGDEYSVALGVHFCMRPIDRLARIYQMNGLLRRLGIHPLPPSRSGWRDSLKSGAIDLITKRNPKTKDELIRSGIRRLTMPMSLTKRLLRRH